MLFVIFYNLKQSAILFKSEDFIIGKKINYFGHRMRKGQVWLQIHSGSTADRCTELKSVFYPLLEDISLLATLKFKFKKSLCYVMFW